MICERCGHEIINNFSSVLCPICGTVTKKHPQEHSLGNVVQISQDHAGEQSTSLFEELPASQTTSQPYTSFSSDEAEYTTKSFYSAKTINTPGMTSFTSSCSYESALVIEFILSLLGIFGIGWLLVDETLIGFLLLACSILIYWPIMILGTLVTLGLGLICLGPLAVTCVICNTLLFNLCLKRRIARRR
jgi:hypothetical protein